MAADVIGDAVELDEPLMDAGMDWGHRGGGVRIGQLKTDELQP